MNNKIAEEYFQPKNINELDQLIKKSHSEITFIAGATDIMVQKEKWDTVATFIDMSTVVELSQGITVGKAGIKIGAAVPLSLLIQHPAIQEKFPILIAALKQIGSVQIQNRATLGGNIANASPAGDSLPVLNVLEAHLLIGPRFNGEFERCTISELMVGPGETSLKNNRYLAYIVIPFPGAENLFWYYRKVGQREALAISKLSLAVLGWCKNRIIENIRISAGAVSPQVTRAFKTEKLLVNQILNPPLIEKAKLSMADEISPITDIRSTKNYRRAICGELLRDALFQLLNE